MGRHARPSDGDVRTESGTDLSVTRDGETLSAPADLSDLTVVPDALPTPPAEREPVELPRPIWEILPSWNGIPPAEPAPVESAPMPTADAARPPAPREPDPVSGPHALVPPSPTGLVVDGPSPASAPDERALGGSAPDVRHRPDDVLLGSSGHSGGAAVTPPDPPQPEAGLAPGSASTDPAGIDGHDRTGDQGAPTTGDAPAADPPVRHRSRRERRAWETSGGSTSDRIPVVRAPLLAQDPPPPRPTLELAEALTSTPRPLRVAPRVPQAVPPPPGYLTPAETAAAIRSRREASATPRRSRGPLVVVAVVVVLLLVAGTVAWLVLGRDDGGGTGTAAANGCATTVGVRLAVTPELAGPLSSVLGEPVRFGASCAQVGLESVEPLQLAGTLEALSADVSPQLWIPDSSTWIGRTSTTIAMTGAGSLASSPVVIASSTAVIDATGWATAPPTWAEALTSGRDLAVQDLAGTAEGVLTLAAMRSSLGAGAAADSAVAQVALAGSRGEVASAGQALATVATGADDAPLVALTEQQVLSSADEAAMTAVYPADGSPFLDYPVVQLGDPAADGEDGLAAAVQAVVGALRSPATATALVDAGFRDPSGIAAAPLGYSSGATAPELVAAIATDPEAVRTMLGQLSTLAAPSRLQLLVDVSSSMSEEDDGTTRAVLARDAMLSALTALPDTASGGIWWVASDLGDDGWAEASPTLGLTDDDLGVPHREALQSVIAGLPDLVSSEDGTPLYDAVLAAVRTQRDTYDATAVNTVVLLTDGEDDGSGSSPDEVVAALGAEADPARPVQVVTVALGPDADTAALEQVAAAGGGAAYTANGPDDLVQVLFDALGRRG